MTQCLAFGNTVEGTAARLNDKCAVIEMHHPAIRNCAANLLDAHAAGKHPPQGPSKARWFALHFLTKLPFSLEPRRKVFHPTGFHRS